MPARQQTPQERAKTSPAEHRVCHDAKDDPRRLWAATERASKSGSAVWAERTRQEAREGDHQHSDACLTERWRTNAAKSAGRRATESKAERSSADTGHAAAEQRRPTWEPGGASPDARARIDRCADRQAAPRPQTDVPPTATPDDPWQTAIGFEERHRAAPTCH